MSGARRSAAAIALVALLAVTPVSPGAIARSAGERQQTASQPPQSPGFGNILRYIARGWDRLTRSMTSCATFEDVKAVGKPTLYLPAGFTETPALKNLEIHCGVSLRHLPEPIRKPGAIDVKAIVPQGLLYLPHPYVVPGGRFNAMYGWDSYFILRGLLLQGRLRLARGMVENFFFELEQYRMILNANRTYYLTRSQPPFLAEMILAVYDAEAATGHNDRAWLERSYPIALQNYDFWTRAPHLAGVTGLSRYYALGSGPAPEVLAGNPGYYREVAAYFRSHPKEADDFLVRKGDRSTGAERVGLTAKFYKADRSMRESGFDVSFRFGPYGDNTPDYAPAGLNSLLYQTERDLERMCSILGRTRQAREWARRAALRRRRIDRYLWNAKRGLYFDYDFVTRRQSTYRFATTFYPLWVGAASPAQARAVAAHLKSFLAPGGVVTSLRTSGAQWDFPYGWAPLQLIAAEGLRRYRLDEEANRVAYRFLGTVLLNFRRDGTIREKYNVVTRSSETNIQAGYRQNVVGFGWTNGVFLALWHTLPRRWQGRLAKEAK